MPSITRRSLLKSAAAVGALLCSPALIGRAYAQSNSLTVASLLGEDKPETMIWLKIRDLVEAQLPGQFSFNIVPNATLGGKGKWPKACGSARSRPASRRQRH